MAEAVLDSVEGKRPSELVESFTPERFVEAV
jgi:hypothetical protein